MMLWDDGLAGFILMGFVRPAPSNEAWDLDDMELCKVDQPLPEVCETFLSHFWSVYNTRRIGQVIGHPLMPQKVRKPWM